MVRTILNQLLYSTAVLTAITATPLVKVEWQLGHEEDARATFHYRELLYNALVALGLTVLAMSPYLAIRTRWRSPYAKMIYWGALLPWCYVCCTKFALGYKTQLRAISYVHDEDHWHNLVFALVCYCVIFGMAMEQMLNWALLYHLVTLILKDWRTHFIIFL
ncbi:uncharacterized protein LOC119556779 [Drosophila subpulchrella]|uniref:uncharacterized protein LOC119556779 n=1 Tax=Drosophila subpulchrella TaxID=1486046 RepID=UPI0018A1AFF2|nr:uncharacterized protein LOC119556779 [Drosophila subpulchrella]XP_037725135.1 uncharacterized protein LOC119556779 [Drosophila subpulchrella]XP_037725136.1 uncharacterized protein LOC119556779 [Drosophila subpulchrella]XP_037725138.1 uncharacterized protein LOC119556779 [Drosophila subpulchrella]XP_037725139.1 uncharacterized protein LOC119556779 [Drosophila subpulchrella]XP_037725140.1 uncharacterized protein LOC119556779 [Drosophila subpulchrella]XP_037725141.1 uncharacterized protein LO